MTHNKARDELLAAAKGVYEFHRLTLSRTGAAGHRVCDDGTIVCDPWTQAYKDLGAAIVKAEGAT